MRLWGKKWSNFNGEDQKNYYKVLKELLDEFQFDTITVGINRTLYKTARKKLRN